MEKITSFNKENLKLLSADIDEALKAVNKKHGINLHVVNISYAKKIGNISYTKLEKIYLEYNTGIAKTENRNIIGMGI